jgi:subtilase family serine protease
VETAQLAHNYSGEKMMIRKHYLLLPILASALAMGIPSLASAQGKKMVLPFNVVQASAKSSVIGLTPAQIKRAYGFDQITNQGSGQTIAIVDAFDTPHIEADLGTFDTQFNLPACTMKSGCLQKVFSCSGKLCNTNPGTSDTNYAFWAMEIALDVEWAHAIAPMANILLVEVNSTGEPLGATLDDLLGGVDVALTHNVSVVSMSWGAGEFSTESADEDWHFIKPNVTFLAGAGDSGHGVIYPAASPFVMSVGGTKLTIDQLGNYQSEKAWAGSGGGLSQYEPEPPFQSAYPIPNDPKLKRGTPDVAYDAKPDTGVAVYDSNSGGWSQVGGTSIGAPQWSGLIALANELRAKDHKPALTGAHGVLYDAAQDSDGYETYHDVSNGKDGTCKLCKAKPGYDFVTGLGTPQADMLIPALRHLLDR